MLKWARSSVALLLTVFLCLASGCSSRAVAQEPKSTQTFSVGCDVVNKVEDGIRIQTAIPVFTGFSAAKGLNEKIRKVSDDGIAELKQTAKELGVSPAEGTLYYQSYYDYVWDNDVLSVWISNENYSGGAHGLRWITSFNLNITTGEFYKTPGDLFKDSDAGTKLVTDKIITDIQKQSIGFFPEAVQTVRDKKGNDSFYLDGQNLVVYYDLYEITPYAAGIPFFKIPLANLETKLRLGGNPPMGDVRVDGMNTTFNHKVISNDNGVFLPLKETGDALCINVLEKDGKYTVNGKSVQPTMIDSVAYMPIQYYNDLLESDAIKGFAVYDGNVLRMFTQTEESAVSGAVSENPLGSTVTSSVTETVETK